MDLSKLPKLSNTQRHIPPADGAAEVAVSVIPMPNRQPIGGAIWFNSIVGLLLLVIGHDFGRFAISKITNQPFHTGVKWLEGPKSGQEVDYFELSGFTAFADMGIFLFGVGVLLEVAVKLLLAFFPRTRSMIILIAFAVATTAAVTLLNCYVCYELLNDQITPTFSALAVAFGGWTLFDQWQMFRSFRR